MSAAPKRLVALVLHPWVSIAISIVAIGISCETRQRTLEFRVEAIERTAPR